MIAGDRDSQYSDSKMDVFSPINFPKSTKTQRNKQIVRHCFAAYFLAYTLETAL